MPDDKQALFRNIPSVDRLLMSPSIMEILQVHPRTLVIRVIHQVLDALRKKIREGNIRQAEPDLTLETVTCFVLRECERLSRPSLRAVVNAAGIVVHTNLGRSILAESVLEKFKPLAGGYSNLEYDLEKGKRGSRYVHVEEILKELTSAEAALVVNNNAAAVLISLETLAKGREVIVSRGQLVEIGGSFRIPDVMRKSGAMMVEVGTTNKTHLSDYEEAIGPNTALVLKVHTSNYQIVGFTEEVPLAELIELGKRQGIPVMEDLGSGCLIDFSRYWLSKEPTVKETLAQGVDVVTFSGDKLLGGPQTGIILGKKEYIEAIKKNPLNRALRIDKLTLLALEETLRLYREEETAIQEIPTLRMILQPVEAVVAKANRLVQKIGTLKSDNFSLKLVDGTTKPGGGSLPLLELPSRLLSLQPNRLSSAQMERRLRDHDPPIIARQEKERVLLDVRTIQDNELEIVAGAVRQLAGVVA
jgi:L-seryl-tRNA(Ser) seleniumtransferase